ncbi:MAG TPA: cupin [Cytophagales bacterium]|nr:cupin [Cytophagales bacterium]
MNNQQTNQIEELINHYNLLPHPEGGFFRQTYVAAELISMEALPERFEGSRSFSTAIYFLLPTGSFSAFHRIKSDELWYFHAGSPLIVHTLSERGHEQHHLGLDLSKGQQPFLWIPKDTIFGSSILDAEGYALVSCAVAPGFDFRDFELFTAEQLLLKFAAHREIIERLT